MPIDYGTNNVTTSGVTTATSGVFANLTVGGNPVSVSGHTHTSSNITNFNSSVSGLISGIYAPLTGTLNQFASTTSAQLASVISDETGGGVLVFNNSPSFTGIPVVPTASSGTNSNQIASTSFVRTEISNLVASAPSTLDTLNELATALGNDANFSTTVTNSLAGKANLSGATFTEAISGPSGDFVVLKQNGTPVSVSGHSHTSSNISDFNSSVSGLLPVKDIIAGSFITVSGVSGSYTISTEGLQPYNGILDAIGAIATPFSNNIIYTTSTNTWSTTSLTAFGRSLIDDTDNTAARSTLGLVIGTNVQAYDATLNALAGVSTTADTIIYATGVDAFSTSSLTSFGRSLIDDADATAAKNTLNISKTIGFFTASDNMPPATNYATIDTRNSILVLDFDGGSANEEAVFAGVIPHNTVTTSGLLVRINWMATTATTGNCRWGVQFEDMNTDTDADSFSTATEAHSATNATAGIPTVTEITCTNIDSLVAGDFYRMKIYRDASDTTNDTMAGDAELISVEVRGI